MKAKEHKPSPKKFNFDDMKKLATSPYRGVRKTVFLEYFEAFSEFPSYLFDNEREIHIDLWQTAQDILADKTISKDVRRGVEQLLARLPSRSE